VKGQTNYTRNHARESVREITSNALVPLSIKSSFVSTPNVLSPGQLTYKDFSDRQLLGQRQEAINPWYINIPEGSTSLEILIASEVAMSWLAGDIASMIQLGCQKQK
jgi:hypothetical protein